MTIPAAFIDPLVIVVFIMIVVAFRLAVLKGFPWKGDRDDQS